MEWLSRHGVAFGTSGVRGPAHCFDPGLCRAILERFLSGLDGPVLIGHDLRRSSPEIAAHCAAAAVACGRPVRFAGPVPAPALALASGFHRLPAVMVTGSHIAADRNGLKFFISGHEISKAAERAIAEAAAPCDAPDAFDVPPAETGIAEAYVARYQQAFDAGALAGLRIGVYEHASVARDLLHEVLRGLGAETVGLGRSTDFVALDTEALPETLVMAARGWAEAGRFDAIVSADADGDRPLIADETGAWLRGDRLGLLAAQACDARTVVTPLTSSSAIELSGTFESVVRTRIGSPYVIAAMQGQAEPTVGFEANGGFILGSEIRCVGGSLGPLLTRDAVLPLLLVLAKMKRTGLPLSALSAQLPQRHSASGRIADVPGSESRNLIDSLASDLARAAQVLAPSCGAIVDTDVTDGLRCCFAGGAIVHLRASGNAPELRCYSEADSGEIADRLAADCLERIARLLEASPLECGQPGCKA